MATKIRFTVLFLTLFTTFIALSNTARAQKKPPKSLPFPVKYRITFVRHPNGDFSPLHRMNNAGIAISALYRGQGYLFDSVTGHACWDVRDLIVDVDLLLIPANGILSTTGISDNGTVAGTVWWRDDEDQERGWAYVFDTGNDLTQQGCILQLIDNSVLAVADQTRAYAVNDAGDVLGAYRDVTFGTWHLFTFHLDSGEYDLFDDLPASTSTDQRSYPVLNNWGQIAGKLRDGLGGFRYTPWFTNKPSRLEIFPEIDKGAEGITGLNDAGVFCGMFHHSSKKGRLYDRPYRCYFTEGTDSPVAIDSVYQNYFSSVRINSSCDLLVSQSGNAIIYHDAFNYLFDVQSLVDVSNLSSEDLALWKSREGLAVMHMTDRYPEPGNPSSLGRLCGELKYYDGHWSDSDSMRQVGFVLTPQYE
jgi:hypothetical protein